MAIGAKTVLYAALAGNLPIAAHSVVNTGNQGLLLYGMRRAQQAPDDEHPFGHGKRVFVESHCSRSGEPGR